MPVRGPPAFHEKPQQQLAAKRLCRAWLRWGGHPKPPRSAQHRLPSGEAPTSLRERGFWGGKGARRRHTGGAGPPRRAVRRGGAAPSGARCRAGPPSLIPRRHGRGRSAGRSPRREVVMVSRVTCVRGSPGTERGGRQAAGGGGGEVSVTDGAGDGAGAAAAAVPGAGRSGAGGCGRRLAPSRGRHRGAAPTCTAARPLRAAA